MSKVICDICGTSYPETAVKCPICGYAKTASETTAARSERSSGDGGYSSVRGGHFSKKNVRKRTGSTASERARRSQNEEGGNTGLILVVIFLLVAIVAVVIYIGLRVFKSPDNELPQSTGTTQVTQPTETTPTDTTDPSNPVDPTDPTDVTNPTDATEDNSIPCESLQLSNQTIEFVNAADTWTIQVRSTPANTTQRVKFTSSDANVVTVDENGLLTAVGPGTATITVTCGQITQTCEIKCSFEAPSVPPTTPADPTDPTGTATDAPTDPTGTSATDPTVPTTVTPTGPVDTSFTFEFNTKFQDATSGKWDTTMQKQGETWKAYKNSLTVDPGAITWTTDDACVCTVENGIVTAVGPGKTEIHAQYGGKTFSCIVRCAFKAGETGNTGNTGNTDSTTPTEPVNNGNATGPYTISSEDMTIAVGDFWWLRLKDKDGNTIENIVWTAEDSSIVSIEGNKIIGVKKGKTTVSTTYEGVTYTCIVRIKAAD